MRPVDPSRALQRRSRFEAFEQRLALTAQPISELSLGIEQQLQHHYSEIAPAQVVDPIGDFQLESVTQDQVSHHAGSATTAAASVHDWTGVNYVFNNFGFSGEGQTVAIIDSGIAWDHVALGGGFGSGYRVVGGYDFAEGDADPYDDGPAGFHGTHVAGIVASSDATYRGVASGVDLVGLRVFDDDGAGYFSLVEQALQWVHEHRTAFENPITTVNLSLGTTWNQDSVPAWATLEDEFAQLAADGIFIAVSAGNSFSDYNRAGLSYPAASPYVVPVASVDNAGAISDFSQRSDRVLAAPGRYITSTVPDHVFGSDGNPNDFGTSSGTSMASPYVAGVSVLVRQAMEFVGIQNITQDTLYEHLRSTADIVYDAATRANYHLINLEAAIKALMPSDDFGSTIGTSYSLGTLTGTSSFAGVIGSLTDADYFTFTASQTGRMTFAFDTTHELTLDAQIVGGSGSFTGNTLTLDVLAGRSYTLALHTTEGVGHYTAQVHVAQSGGGAQSDGESTSDAGGASVDPLAKAAYELDQAKSLRFNGNDYLNWGGTNEKWLQGSDGWYFVRPTGEVYKWIGYGKARGTLVATLDATYYTDLSKLYDAEPPATSGGAAENGEDNSAGAGANTGTGSGSANSGSESGQNTSGGANDGNSGSESSLANRARALDSQYGFNTDGKFHENWAGHGEKWFRSDKLGWVFITPDGGLYDWNGSQATAIASPQIAQLDASYHSDPTLLTDPPAEGGSNSGGQSGSSGGATQGGDSSTGTGQEDTKTGGSTSAGDALAKRAYELDQQLGLRSTGDYYVNWAKLGEKWMTSANGQWYFITADGSLYRWNGSQANAASSTRVAKLDASFHADPNKLHDAPNVSSMSVNAVAPRVQPATVSVDAGWLSDSMRATTASKVSSLARIRENLFASSTGIEATDAAIDDLTSRLHVFAEYGASDKTRFHDGPRLATAISNDEETLAVDLVYGNLEMVESQVDQRNTSLAMFVH